MSVKSTALVSLALAAGWLTLPFSLRRAAAAVLHASGDPTRFVCGACSVFCCSRCSLLLLLLCFVFVFVFLVYS
ncbi:hypothetical protein Q8G11_17090, partial [Klebsiella pneumoniae]|nr:hypothetical protein [Klebsiella pneumoniae]